MFLSVFNLALDSKLDTLDFPSVVTLPLTAFSGTSLLVLMADFLTASLLILLLLFASDCETLFLVSLVLVVTNLSLTLIEI